MAVYDYRCEICDEIFDIDLPMGKEKPPVRCPVCGCWMTKRIYIYVPALKIDFGPNGIGDTSLPKFQKATRSKRYREEAEDLED